MSHVSINWVGRGSLLPTRELALMGCADPFTGRGGAPSSLSYLPVKNNPTIFSKVYFRIILGYILTEHCSFFFLE